jgi:PPOX class probable F420-dependent enzyme
MPAAPVPTSVDQFLAAPNLAVIASLDRGGSPHTAATWYDWEDGRVLLNMDHSRVRLDHLRRDPRVSITVIDRDDWYRHITLTGSVGEIYDDEGLADIDRLALRYTGQAYLTRDSPRVSAWIEVERWHGWDASGDRKVTDASWRVGAG